MKICPVCEAKAFDDAEVCYGCLYRFEDDFEAIERIEEADAESPQAISFPEIPPSFLIRFTPTREETGSVRWACAVEV